MAAERSRCAAGRGLRLALLWFQFDAAHVKLAAAQQRLTKGAAGACGKEITHWELQSAVLASRRRGDLNDIEPRAFRAGSLRDEIEAESYCVWRDTRHDANFDIDAGYSSPTRGFIDERHDPLSDR